MCFCMLDRISMMNLPHQQLQEVHEAVAARLVALEEAMNSELSELAAAGQAQLAALSRVLGDKMGAIAELKAAFEGQLNAAWQDYGEAYGQLAAVQEVRRMWGRLGVGYGDGGMGWGSKPSDGLLATMQR